MNKNLKAVYFCATNGQRWGKGLTIKAAKSAAGLVSTTQEKRVEFYVQAALFNNPTEEELENMRQCITANGIDGSPMFYESGRSTEDTEMINRLHIGWLIIEKNYN